MKNIKKILSVLSAVTIMGTCGVTNVSAINENETDIETGIQSDEKITDTSVIFKMIENFIKEQNLDAEACIDYITIVDDINNPVYQQRIEIVGISINDEETGEILHKFIDENSIDETKIFMSISTNHKTHGDANDDGFVNIRDASFIASMLAHGRADELTDVADYNFDGFVNIRDAMSLARHLVIK